MLASIIQLTSVVDSDNTPLCVGMRLIFDYADKASEYGVITNISDVDGDMDEEGRMFGINPKVEVTFEDGEVEEFTTSDTRQGWWSEEGYQADDLLAAPYGPFQQ